MDKSSVRGIELDSTHDGYHYCSFTFEFSGRGGGTNDLETFGEAS